MRPIVRVTFDRPHSGYWDGGARSGGDFESYGKEHPGKDHIIRWGCFELNFWFNCGSGRSWKEAASIAKRWIERHMRWSGTVKIVWLDNS
mgnify:FL=1